MKVINIEYLSLKSIKNAERRKTRLENDGYTLVKESAGLTTGQLIYEKKVG